MAGSYNRVLLMGNLTRDPELRHLPSNQAIATLGVAVNRRYRTADGEQREETTFVDCDAFGRTAEVMCQYLHKGSPVFIEGRLRLDEWQDKETGGKRTKLKVVIENFQFVESRGDSQGGGGGGGGGPRRSGAGSRSGGGDSGGGGARYEPIGEDDIPF